MKKPTKRAVKTIVRRKGWPVWARYIWKGTTHWFFSDKKPAWINGDDFYNNIFGWCFMGENHKRTTAAQRRASLRRILSPKGRA